VRCGHNSEVAVPLNVVSRLEEINSNSIEYASGTAVVQYRGAIIPVIDLGACFGVPREIHSTDTLQCFVCRSGDQEAAFIVESVRDIVDVEISVESKSPLAFIKSTAVIDGRVTDILDPDRACEMHCAHLFQDRRG
jgi:two-component system chemotaxis sensor kinase CheA